MILLICGCNDHIHFNSINNTNFIVIAIPVAVADVTVVAIVADLTLSIRKLLVPP